MPFKNLMEVIVTAVVNEVLLKEDRDIPDYESYKQDIITYVLNRMPPKYYTSERGILHGMLEAHYTSQQKADILFFTHEAINIIKSRRTSELPPNLKADENKILNLPHIIGEVLEETTFSIIPDIKVLLLYNGGPAKMKDATWKNPYITSKSTEGYYHFWPDFSEDEMDKNSSIPFSIVFGHPKLKEKNIDFKLNVQDTYNFYKSHVMPITLLQTTEGVDISSIA